MLADRHAELLFDYASGAAPEPVALAVAAQLELKPELQSAYAQLNAVGGALLDDLEPASVAEGGLDAVLAQLDAIGQEPAGAERRRRSAGRLPSALHSYVGSDYDNLTWRSLGGGVQEHVIPTRSKGYRTSLMRIAPGRAMPRHTHMGEEMTLVLEGGYSDGAQQFGPGDLQLADEQTVHSPLADPEGCLCLVVLTAPLKVSGVLGWFVNPFLRYN